MYTLYTSGKHKKIGTVLALSVLYRKPYIFKPVLFGFYLNFKEG